MKDALEKSYKSPLRRRNRLVLGILFLSAAATVIFTIGLMVLGACGGGSGGGSDYVSDAFPALGEPLALTL